MTGHIACNSKWDRNIIMTRLVLNGEGWSAVGRRFQISPGRVRQCVSGVLHKADGIREIADQDQACATLWRWLPLAYLRMHREEILEAVNNLDLG